MEIEWMAARKSDPVKLTQLAHHGRIFIWELISLSNSLSYSLSLFVFILKDIILEEILHKRMNFFWNKSPR